jgi:hypothetical protein
MGNICIMHLFASRSGSDTKSRSHWPPIRSLHIAASISAIGPLLGGEYWPLHLSRPPSYSPQFVASKKVYRSLQRRPLIQSDCQFEYDFVFKGFVLSGHMKGQLKPLKSLRPASRSTPPPSPSPPSSLTAGDHG